MRVDLTRSIRLEAPVAQVWAQLAAVEQVAACVPNLSGLALSPSGDYAAQASDRVGPFKVSMPVRLRVELEPAANIVRADVVGHDRASQTRVTATISAECTAVDAVTTTLTVRAGGEVLGPIATLGGGPIRRRFDDIFDGFIACVTRRIQDRDVTSAQA
jgi:carbon monoxide dehydrogenase subunit G